MTVLLLSKNKVFIRRQKIVDFKDFGVVAQIENKTKKFQFYAILCKSINSQQPNSRNHPFFTKDGTAINTTVFPLRSKTQV